MLNVHTRLRLIDVINHKEYEARHTCWYPHAHTHMEGWRFERANNSALFIIALRSICGLVICSSVGRFFIYIVNNFFPFKTEEIH